MFAIGTITGLGLGYTFASALGLAASHFERGDVQGMRHLHDNLTGQVSVGYEVGIYQLSLLTYVLSKIMSKPRFWKQARQNSYWMAARKQLRAAESAAKAGQPSPALGILQEIFSRIGDAEGQDQRFAKGLLLKARIKAASTFYAQGLSLGRAAEMTGLDKREILAYAGQTTMNERLPPQMAVAARMKTLRSLFGSNSK